MASTSITEELAERIATEIDVQKIKFDRMIDHLERSISLSRDALHPVLANKAGIEKMNIDYAYFSRKGKKGQ